MEHDQFLWQHVPCHVHVTIINVRLREKKTEALTVAQISWNNKVDKRNPGVRERERERCVCMSFSPGPRPSPSSLPLLTPTHSDWCECLERVPRPFTVTDNDNKQIGYTNTDI